MIINPYRYGGSSLYPYSITIANPGAESGSVSDWTQDVATTFTVASGTLDSTEIGAGIGPYAGTYSYYHGSTSISIVHQDISISGINPTVLADIDAGRCFLNLGVWLITDAGGSDYGSPNVHFYDGSSNWLAGTKHDVLRPISSWQHQTFNNIPIPENTRTIRLAVRAIRNGGDAKVNVYWDDFTMTVTKRSGSGQHATIASIKPTATTGWTNVTGTCTFTSAVGSLAFGGDDWGFDPAIRWGNNATGHCYYTISLPSGWNTDIDNGLVTLKTRYRHHDDAGAGATGRTYIEFYDSGPTIIGSRSYSEASEQQFTKYISGGWHDVDYSVPANARSVRFGHMGTKTALTTLYHHIQYASVYLYK